jgi:DNA-binding MarR family transcriptional regulator
MVVGTTILVRTMSSSHTRAAPSGPLSPRELAAWRGMLQVHARVARALDAQMRAEHGLTVSQYEVLLFLAGAPGRRLRMSEIADRALLTRSGLTRLVDRLVELGHVTRCAAEQDGRGSFAELTEQGRAAFAAAQRTHREGVRRFFLDRLSPADQEALAGVWTRFLAA